MTYDATQSATARLDEWITRTGFNGADRRTFDDRSRPDDGPPFDEWDVPPDDGPASDEQEPPPAAAPYTRRPLDWTRLADLEPPDRDWAIEGWLGMGHVTLLAGLGGIGKTLLAQAVGSALALGRQYIDTVPQPRRVLMWAAEDDDNELWRRQLAIAAHFRAPLSDFADAFTVESFADRDCTLMDADLSGRLALTGMYRELAEQIRGLRADVVILDNSARLFAGREIDRAQVTRFVAMLNAAAGGAAVLLLAHPGRAAGSEYSGSTAWENAVRARMFLSDRPPGATASPDDEPNGDARYLARRKANYSARDLRTLRYENGVLVPEQAAPGELMGGLARKRNESIVLAATRKLIEVGQQPTDGASSPAYLPKLIVEFRLHEGRTRRDLADAMRSLMVEGKLRREVIGKYANRSDRFGLVPTE